MEGNQNKEGERIRVPLQTVIRQAYSPRNRLPCSLKGNTSTSSDEDYSDENDAHCGNTSISSDVDDIFIYIKRWQSAESDKYKVFSGKSSDCNGDGGYSDDDDNDVGGVGIKQVHRPHESLAILRHSFLLWLFWALCIRQNWLFWEKNVGNAHIFRLKFSQYDDRYSLFWKKNYGMAVAIIFGMIDFW